jgi:hypothetical protein
VSKFFKTRHRWHFCIGAVHCILEYCGVGGCGHVVGMLRNLRACPVSARAPTLLLREIREGVGAHYGDLFGSAGCGRC